jgi:hypothetical protein
MNSLNKGVVFAGAVSMALTGSVLGQNLFSNAGFETGAYSTSGSGSTPLAFAGQNAHSAANTGTGGTTTGWSIDSWTFNSGSNGLSERYMRDVDDTVRAYAGNRYVFLSTTTQTGGGNACLQYTDGAGISFTGGTTYRFSFYAADAGSTGSAPVIGFEVQGGGGPNVLQTVTLPTNGAWNNSSTTETAIPWTQYTFNWTPTTTYSAPAFYWSVFAGTTSGSVGSVVLDNVSVSVAAVPEAETVAAGLFMAGLVGATWYRRRQAQA